MASSSEKTYTKKQIQLMREQVGKIRNAGNDQKLLSKFMSDWGMPHNVTLAQFVEQCAEGVPAEAEPEVVEVKAKPDKDK